MRKVATSKTQGVNKENIPLKKGILKMHRAKKRPLVKMRHHKNEKA
jgi:hypothetical protein